MVAHGQKLIKMVDASELGWMVVIEYVVNPLASDSEDEKRMGGGGSHNRNCVLASVVVS